MTTLADGKIKNEIDRVQVVRHYILDRLERGVYKSGQRLPGARKIADETGVSFLMTQHAIESLAQDGILEVLARRGAFVQSKWKTRVLDDNFCVFDIATTRSWIPDVIEMLQESLPGLRQTTIFEKSTLEYRPTAYVQSHASEYLDLSGYFDECFPEKSDFFLDPFKRFQIGGSLVGIPFIFSPRVIFINSTLFEKCGCKVPQSGWGWDEFIQTVRTLGKHLPEDRIINWVNQSYLWMNFIMRAGGKLFDANAEDKILLDNAKTIKGLELFCQLRKEIGAGREHIFNTYKDFADGKMAMFISGRQMRHILNDANDFSWSAVAMPVIDGGCDIMAQATDVLCVRKSCTSGKLIRTFIKTMLSPEVQNYVAEIRYGIPIRQSSALKSLNLNEETDSLFAREMSKVAGEYCLSSLTLSSLVADGIEQLIDSGKDLKAGMEKLAEMARFYLEIKKYADANNNNNLD